MAQKNLSLMGFVLSAVAILGAALAALGVLQLSATLPLLVAGVILGYLSLAMYRQSSVVTYRESQLSLLQSQLTEQRTAIDSLADGLDLALFVCDARGLVQYANEPAQRMFGFENPAGRMLLAVTQSPQLESLLVKAVEKRTGQAGEVQLSYPLERVTLAKAWFHSEVPNQVFVSLYDITELRRLMRIRQDFVANVSHELRTPLTVIRAMAETLLDEETEPSELGRRYLNKMIEEVDRLNTITQDLLVLSSAESSNVQKENCDLVPIFRDVLSELEPQAAAKGLATVYIGPETVVAPASKSQMTQVAINLIQNAINYTHAGSITLRIAKSDGDATIEIVDTGIGISSENVPRIFERFYRVDKARSRSTGGTGLGLSIVRHIVEAHGGTVTVQSALNQGSTFTVRLPLE